MSAAVIAKDLLGTLQRLGGLEARTGDALKNQERIETKLDTLLDRLARVEANYDHLRKNVKSEILAEIGRELSTTQLILALQARGVPLGFTVDENKLSDVTKK